MKMVDFSKNLFCFDQSQLTSVFLLRCVVRLFSFSFKSASHLSSSFEYSSLSCSRSDAWSSKNFRVSFSCLSAVSIWKFEWMKINKIQDLMSWNNSYLRIEILASFPLSFHVAISLTNKVFNHLVQYLHILIEFELLAGVRCEKYFGLFLQLIETEAHIFWPWCRLLCAESEKQSETWCLWPKNHFLSQLVQLTLLWDLLWPAYSYR